MKEISSTQKLCSSYVSNMHFATMILPFVNKQIKEKTSVVTFLENNFTTNIELVLSRLTISDEVKKEILKINWKDTNATKYLNIEKILKMQLNKNCNNIIIVNGNEEYINIINECIDRCIQKNHKKFEKTSIKIMNFYEVRKF